ncbi:hypothetical protein NBH00_09735 [Paraconexibacter antarcticus]|uniref:Lipoprotein n=1 Tax=Paraconexibacter antarcticus TaxID=2949664 RepID=A0ABY5DWS6_9ACTN|nr:hypothetical protein [Paraconexibacter antarcticus]UTI66473.1 hypothetical protein NBH00_09735 [Paraconexibacter antarcticus]
MPPVRSAAALAGTAVATAALVLSACGTPSADLMVVERTGTIPGAKLTLRLQDGGEVTCNGKGGKMMPSHQLIDAREVLRELEGGAVDRQNDVTSSSGPLDRHLTLPPGPRSILRYRVRAEEGTVAFSDDSAKQPAAFFKLAVLVRGIAKGVCGLPR